MYFSFVFWSKCLIAGRWCCQPIKEQRAKILWLCSQPLRSDLFVQGLVGFVRRGVRSKLNILLACPYKQIVVTFRSTDWIVPARYALTILLCTEHEISFNTTKANSCFIYIAFQLNNWKKYLWLRPQVCTNTTYILHILLGIIPYMC